MPATEDIKMERLGELGDACTTCGAPLDVDQRYCLECGTRRGDARLPFEQYLPGGLDADAADNGGGGGAAAAQAPSERQNEPSPIGAVIGVALLGTMLLLGVLLGRGGGDNNTAAPAPVVVGETTGTAGTNGGGAETVSNTKVTSEWPHGKNGWTVELGSLPKDGTTSTDVEATKSDLTDKGASDVGVLDSDLYPSLPGGNYVIYSGVYDSKGDAEAALKDLGKDFPDATVIEVSTEKSSPGGGGGGGGDTSSGGGSLLSGENAGGKPGDTVEASEADLQALENTTGDDYQEQLNNIPDTIATPGEAPPDDPSVEPGGGTQGEVIR